VDVMTPFGSSMTQTLISPSYRRRLQEGTTSGRNRVFERRVCERRVGELIYLEGSVMGTAITYIMVRIMIR
jgi:hypothetical protein